MTRFPHILIFGCGNMGGAMLRGWVAAGAPTESFTVIDPVASDLPEGVRLYRTADELNGTYDTVLLGIKPQMLSALAPDIARLLPPDALLLSLLAGTRTVSLSSHFPNARVVRLMPNLAAAIGKSPLGLFSTQLGSNDRAELERDLSALGTAVWLEEEGQMDAVTALAGSGPAFVYRFIDALAQGGSQIGLAPETAARLALAMVEGATQLATAANETPAELAARVTSPGGTTAAGLAVLDADDALTRLVQDTLRAAKNRGAELAMGEND
ncbi:MAG: pyrroline-5-carboxylate reductase [Sphingomonadaceae bacterium]|nr:pyrroline-5-carboxylate reductase [Sphingomonadaceae bacterium]